MLKQILLAFIFGALINSSFALEAKNLPKDFVYLSDIDSSIIQNIRYATNDNFVGRPIAGYRAGRCILTRRAANALATLQKELQKKSLGLKVFDCYRPTAAVADFEAWSRNESDQKQKAYYYPNVNKADFFKLGYVAEKSGHSRGSTVDVTIVQQGGREMNMGTHFDYMDIDSHFLSPNITRAAQKNRLFLRRAMMKAGFNPINDEWWHFVFKKEPFPNKYFNFPVE